MRIYDYGFSVLFYIPLRIDIFKINYKTEETIYKGFGISLFLIGISFCLEEDIEKNYV